MEKLDIQSLGEMIAEWKDGKPWTATKNPQKSAEEIAEKVNEIIDYLNTNKDNDYSDVDVGGYDEYKQEGKEI